MGNEGKNGFAPKVTGDGCLADKKGNRSFEEKEHEGKGTEEEKHRE